MFYHSFLIIYSFFFYKAIMNWKIMYIIKFNWNNNKRIFDEVLTYNEQNNLLVILSFVRDFFLNSTPYIKLYVFSIVNK